MQQNIPEAAYSLNYSARYVVLRSISFHQPFFDISLHRSASQSPSIPSDRKTSLAAAHTGRDGGQALRPLGAQERQQQHRAGGHHSCCVSCYIRAARVRLLSTSVTMRATPSDPQHKLSKRATPLKHLVRNISKVWVSRPPSLR